VVKVPSVKTQAAAKLTPSKPAPKPVRRGDPTLLHVKWASYLPPPQHEEKFDEPGYLAFYPEVGKWLPLSVAELDQHPNRIDWEYSP
jgi:hypothetical protein